MAASCSATGDSPCLNGGVCTNTPGVGRFACACPEPLASNEDGDICVDECASSPCLNGGECTDRTGRFNCDCPPHYGGVACDRYCGPEQDCCEDDPDWIEAPFFANGNTRTIRHTCATIDERCTSFGQERWHDANGVSATEACPLRCGSGCARTFDDCCARKLASCF